MQEERDKLVCKSKTKKKIHPSIVPVVVHVTDEHGVEGVEVSAEHGELIQDEQLGLLVVTFAVGLQQLLLGHDLRLQHINNSSPQINSLVSVSSRGPVQLSSNSLLPASSLIK